MTWFRVWIEINLVFVSGGIKIDVFRVGIEIDLPSVLGSKLTWLCVGDRKWLVFVRGSNRLGFRMRAENGLFSVWGSIGLVLVRGSKLTCFLCGWSKLTWLRCEGWNLTWFQRRDEMHYCRLLCGRSKVTWFQCRGRNWLGFWVPVENDFFLISG